MSPFVLALAAAGGMALVLLGAGGAALAWRRARDRDLTRRIRRTAAPLEGPAPSGDDAGEESIFRPADKRTWVAGTREFIESRYPFLEARRALPVAAAAGVAGAAGGLFAMWFLKVPAGWWTAPIAALAGVAAGRNALMWLQARQEAEFVRHFPEIVDQIVRLAGAGVPALEALARMLPLTYAVSLLRGIWTGETWWAHAGDVAALGVVFAVGTAVASRVFRWE